MRSLKLNIYHSYDLLLYCGILSLFSIYSSAQVDFHNIFKIEDKYDQLGEIFHAKQAMVEDSLGYIWIATGKGLCRYGGSSVQCMTHDKNDPESIDGNGVMYVNLDSDHLIWASLHHDGLNAFDIEGRKIFDLAYEPNVKNSLLHNQVWATWEDSDGYIWISYFYGGISRFDKKTGVLSHFSIDNSEDLKLHRPKTVVSVHPHVSEPHTYWLATTVGLVKFNTRTQESTSFLFEGEIEEKTSESQYNRSKLKPLWARSMCKDSKDNLWIGTFGGLIHFNTQNETYKIFRNVEGNILNMVAGVMTYDKEHILLAYYDGLALLNIESKKLTVLNRVDGINPNHYLYGRMYRAKNGCTYFLNRSGTKTGIHKYCEISDIVKDYRTNHYIASIVTSDNYIHYHRNPGKVESKNIHTGKKIQHTFEIKNGSTIRSMFHYGGDSILVSDVYHMYMYHPRDGLKKIDKLSQSDVYRHESVFVDSDGDIWNGRQRNGLYRLSSSGVVQHYNHESSPALVYQDYIVDILEDDESDIWVATEQGWTIFNKETNTTQNYLSKDVSAPYDFDLRTIKALGQSQKGLVWIGGNTSGLSLWDKKKEKFVTNINQSNGLRSNSIYDITIDPEENVWLATDQGISWVNSTSFETKNFGKEYGISGATYALSIKNRTIYVGHHHGYYHVNIDSLLQHHRPTPKPIINGFEIFDKKQDSLLFTDGGISLSNDQNFFSFSFGSINYFDPALESYEYQLIGVDNNWILDRGDRKKGYTNIAPGKYTFQVRVKTESDQWSPPTIKRITIHPAWYQTLFFKFLLILFAVSMIGLAIKMYLRSQRRKLEVDRRFAQLETMILKSQMNPHFIFNSLNSIRYLFMKDEKDKGLKYITKFAKLLRTTLHHGDQALVRLEDEIELAELFIQLEQLRFDEQFTFTPEYSENQAWKEVLIPPFVIQPLVENAFWHGLLPSKKDGKNLKIQISKMEQGFIISVEDNGVGLNAESNHSKNEALNKTKSYGLNIIKERFHLMNKSDQNQYSIDVSDRIEDESGVRINITIKIK